MVCGSSADVVGSLRLEQNVDNIHVISNLIRNASGGILLGLLRRNICL